MKYYWNSWGGDWDVTITQSNGQKDYYVWTRGKQPFKVMRNRQCLGMFHSGWCDAKGNRIGDGKDVYKKDQWRNLVYYYFS